MVARRGLRKPASRLHVSEAETSLRTAAAACSAGAELGHGPRQPEPM